MKNCNLEILRYLEGKNGSWAPSTIHTAYSKLVTVSDCLDSPGALFEKLSKQNYSRYTIKTYFTLAAQFETAVKKTTHFKDWISSNRLHFKHAYKKKNKVIKEQEVERFLEIARNVNKDFFNFMVLISKAGLRKSEALVVKWLDINNDKLEVRSGKGGKQRFVPFDISWLVDSKNRDLDDTIVPETLNVAVLIKRHCGSFTPHDFRAFYATKLVSLGMQIQDVAELLGHSTIETTARYLRADKERQAKIVMEGF